MAQAGPRPPARPARRTGNESPWRGSVMMADREKEEYDLSALWPEMGPPMPGNEAVARTSSRILRPRTPVFVLSAHENVPLP